MKKVKKEKIKKLEFEHREVIINETYIDDDGHERERQKTIKVPIFDKVDKEHLMPIAKKIGKEIKKMKVETEFTIKNFINKYNVEEKDKSVLCNLVLDYCRDNKIIVLDKPTDNDSLEMPCDRIRIKKK